MTTHRKVMFLILLVVSIMLSGETSAFAAPPVKLVLTTHIGWEIDQITKKNVCTVVSKDPCHAITSSEPGGFEYPEGVAGAPNDTIYVTDKGNHRVQELTSAGEFVSMFGKEVNGTTHGDICTEEEIKISGVKCGPGKDGTSAGALSGLHSIAVDPVSKNVYVQDFANWRVDEYTPTGQLVLMIGKEVNETVVKAVSAKGGTATAKELEEENICTVASKDVCKAGLPSPIDSTEKGAFDFEQGPTDLLAFGGAENRLYVGDSHRVQEFNAQGESKGEIKIPGNIISSAPEGRITAISVGANTTYIVYAHGSLIHEFDANTGEFKGDLSIPPREANGTIEIRAIAIDTLGRLAVAINENIGKKSSQFGELFDVATVKTRFTIEGAGNVRIIQGITFNGNDELYIPSSETTEISHYVPEPVGEPISGLAECKPGTEVGTSETFMCVLKGEINPYNVPGTEIWFEWNRTCGDYLTSTPVQSVQTVATPIPVSALVTSLRPHDSLCYRLTAIDSNIDRSEELTGENMIVNTPMVPPKILNTVPTASYVTSSSVVMYGELNPENTNTEYYFEYAPETKTGENPLASCESVKKAGCPGVLATPILESEAYGTIGATLEVKNLHPLTSYHYRLAARNEGGEPPASTEGTFVTNPTAIVPIVEKPSEEKYEQAPVLQSPPPVAILPLPKIVFPIAHSHTPPKCKHGYTRRHRTCKRTKKKNKTK